ncbi:hypothetical protein ACFL20_07805 [Spirochaetota bacterium]
MAFAVVFSIGCSESGDSISSNECMVCHDSSTEEGQLKMQAQFGYENSAHLLGPRTFYPADVNAGHLTSFHGSNAMYANGNDCSPCHNHEQFVGIEEVGQSPIGCFTCHNPHETKDFSLRTTAAVTLSTGTTFDRGSGNICVACHQSRGTWAEYEADADTSFPVNQYSRTGPHHGPQGDMLAGVNNAALNSTELGGVTALDYSTLTPKHMSSNSCVSCHMFRVSGGDARISGNAQLGGHGFYLKAEVHGSMKELVLSCNACHTTDDIDGSSRSAAFTKMDRNTTLSYDDNTTDGNLILQEIKDMEDALVYYFACDYTFGTSGEVPIKAVTGGTLDGCSGLVSSDYIKDYEFDTSVKNLNMPKAVAKALWNLKFHVEDKSGGVHNPTFAANMLWDACQVIADLDVDTCNNGGNTRP